MSDTNGIVDWMARYRQEQVENEKQGKSYLFGLLPLLKEKGVTRLVVEYEGSGDSGDIQDVQAFTTFLDDEKRLDIPELNKTEVGNAAYYVLESQHGGWEINAGSWGEIVLDVPAGKIIVKHNQRYQDSTYSESEV